MNNAVTRWLNLTLLGMALSDPDCQAASTNIGDGPLIGVKQVFPFIGVYTVGPLASNVLHNVTAWIWQNLAPSRYLGELKAFDAADQNELIRFAMSAAGQSNCLATVVLVGSATDRSVTNAVFVTNSVAVVYLMALGSAEAPPGDADSRWMRRVQKESLHAAGLALGLRPCVFPLCAMHPPQTEHELDTKAVNLCPPCQMKLERLLPQKGIPPDWRYQ